MFVWTGSNAPAFQDLKALEDSVEQSILREEQALASSSDCTVGATDAAALQRKYEVRPVIVIEATAISLIHSGRAGASQEEARGSRHEERANHT